MIKKILQYGFIIAIFFPLLFLIVLSLGKNWAFPFVFPNELSIKNWFVFADNESQIGGLFLQSLVLSTIVSFLVTTSSFLISKSISYSKYKTVFLILAYIPYLLSPVVMAIIFQYFFIVANLNATFIGVILAQFIIALPFGIIIFSNFWNDQIKQYENLSATLGSPKNYTFKKILLPLAKPTFILCFFQIFLVSWFEFGLTRIIGAGKIKTLTLSVFKYINEANVFYAALASCLLILPPMLLIYINKKVLFFVENQKEN